MKRKPEPEYSLGLYRTFPLFNWYKCCRCGLEFRYECGWRFLSGPFYGHLADTRYICRSCAPTKKDAIKIANDNNTWGSVPTTRPKWPPPPPAPTPKGVVKNDKGGN